MEPDYSGPQQDTCVQALAVGPGRAAEITDSVPHLGSSGVPCVLAATPRKMQGAGLRGKGGSEQHWKTEVTAVGEGGQTPPFGQLHSTRRDSIRGDNRDCSPL